jgi:hypothetical protein
MNDVINNGMTPEQAIDKAFKRAEAIFAKYPIAQSRTTFAGALIF